MEKKIRDVENKIPSISGVVTTAALNTKIVKSENKIHDASGLVKKTAYNAKISKIEKKYFTTCDYKKFTNDKLDVKIKQKKIGQLM